MSAVDRAALEQLRAAAAPLPWRAGEPMWSYVYPDPDDPDEPDACSYCGRGELISTDEVDGNLRHLHMVDADHLIYGAGGEKVTGNYDWEDGGIVRAEDTQFVVAVVNALPALLAALDVANAKLLGGPTVRAQLYAQSRAYSELITWACRDDEWWRLRLGIDDPAPRWHREPVPSSRDGLTPLGWVEIPQDVTVRAAAGQEENDCG
ncbi:hypothetical protein [Frankia sp. AgB32]|uniref:hypothetical protein n=1 Tax=Frankia sp. AgB32 TaxID=631119 RepID=UPI00200C81B5|nr:hypothetical protein [Frankia sp. AgB32]MCK9897668.1 hypothetical protein [Frankia sp. AgB32]